MARCQRYLEVIDEDGLLANTSTVGAYLARRLNELAAEFPTLILNPRGLGLMCAFSLPDGATRDAMTDKLYAGGVVLLGSGSTSIRFRPPLTLTQGEVDEAVAVLRRVAAEMTAR